jgi:uncharacterized protein YjbI with pentapeptide repeats
MLQGARLDAADATGAALGRANLREADLTTAVLSGADLQGAALARANLEGARLNGADLRGADLSGATLRGADLWQANLRGCNLKDADLRGADLSQADLQEAILWRADLRDASLNGARLRETHLERANLSGAGGLTWEQGNDAFTDENTILPSYLTGGRPAAEVAAERLVLTPGESEPPWPPERPEETPTIQADGRAGPASAPAPNVAQLQETLRKPEDQADSEPARRGGKKLARPRRRNPALVGPPPSV